jgi:hypothetical protein
VEKLLVLPAISVARTVKVLLPPAKDTLVKLYFPVLSAVTVNGVPFCPRTGEVTPLTPVCSKIRIAPGSVNPASVTVLNLVLLSPIISESEVASRLKMG